MRVFNLDGCRFEPSSSFKRAGEPRNLVLPSDPSRCTPRRASWPHASSSRYRRSRVLHRAANRQPSFGERQQRALAVSLDQLVGLGGSEASEELLHGVATLAPFLLPSS